MGDHSAKNKEHRGESSTMGKHIMVPPRTSANNQSQKRCRVLPWMFRCSGPMVLSGQGLSQVLTGSWLLIQDRKKSTQIC